MRKLRHKAPKTAQLVRGRARTPTQLRQTQNVLTTASCLPPSKLHLDKGGQGLATRRGPSRPAVRTEGLPGPAVWTNSRNLGLSPAPPAYTRLPIHMMREVTWGQGSRDTHLLNSRAQGSEPPRELKGVSHVGSQEPIPLRSPTLTRAPEGTTLHGNTSPQTPPR